MAAAAAAESDPAEFDLVARGTEWRWEVKSNSSQSVASLGSCPSTAPTLSDLPLTPIPELLRTPTKRKTRIAGAPTTSPPAQPADFLHLSTLPSPLDSGPILDQLTQGEKDISTIQNVRCSDTRSSENTPLIADPFSFPLRNEHTTGAPQPRQQMAKHGNDA
jgi:hypothetical protein